MYFPTPRCQFSEQLCDTSESARLRGQPHAREDVVSSLHIEASSPSSFAPHDSRTGRCTGVNSSESLPNRDQFSKQRCVTANTQKPCFYGKCKKFRESSQEVPFRVKISYWFYYNVHNVPNVPSLKRYPIYARHPPLFAMFRLASQLLSPLHNSRNKRNFRTLLQ